MGSAFELRLDQDADDMVVDGISRYVYNVDTYKLR